LTHDLGHVGPGKVAAQRFPGKSDLVGGLGDRFRLAADHQIDGLHYPFRNTLRWPSIGRRCGLIEGGERPFGWHRRDLFHDRHHRPGPIIRNAPKRHVFELALQGTRLFARLCA
jgi:hypothetical protein